MDTCTTTTKDYKPLRWQTGRGCNNRTKVRPTRR